MHRITIHMDGQWMFVGWFPESSQLGTKSDPGENSQGIRYAARNLMELAGLAGFIDGDERAG
jgi:hypothetical protein